MFSQAYCRKVSFLQYLTAYLPVKHLTEANILLQQLNRLSSTLKYKKGNAGFVNVFTISDASFNIAAGLEYG